jgi:multiple sugar transport system substrate-binding protein
VKSKNCPLQNPIINFQHHENENGEKIMTRFYRRSIFLVLAALLIASLAVACGAPAAEAPPVEEEEAPPPAEEEVAGPASLDFVVWSYGIETIQDNIANFQAANPECEINLQDYSWLDYHDTMVGRFAAGDPPPLLYGSDHWLQEWGSAGWLGSISENFPEVLEYDDELAPYALQGMTYEGDVYGLSYYADTIDFVYNEEHLKEAGFDAPPETWQDVWDMSVALKEQGITEYPLILAFSQEEGASIEAMISMIYGRHEGSGALFDENNQPTFNQEGSAAYEAIEWLREAYEAELFDPASLTTAELDQVASMQAGAHTFTILPQYNMAALNLPESGDYAGSFMIGLMPGDSHASWAVENGLGFAQLPLFEDPEVQEAFGQWGDVDVIYAQAELARAKEGLTPWFGTWDVFTRAEIHKAILGQQSTMDTLNNMADYWNELASQ